MATSRYANTPKLVVDGVTTYGTWVAPSWMEQRPEAGKIGKFTVTSEFESRPHLIAGAIYNDQTLDWVLLAFNRVDNPFGWPRAGLVIEYPAEDIVFPEL